MATYYVNQKLTTGNNDGSSAANAWRSLYDCAIGSGPTFGSVIEIAAGSGPYYEADNQSASFKVRASDVSFDRAARRIRSTASTFGSFTAGHRIRVMGSQYNDGQYTVASVSGAGPYDLIVDSTNNLIDENAGNTIRIVTIEPATGTRIPFVFSQGRNGGAGNPIIWNMNGCEISAGWPLVNSSHRWNASRVPGEYYVTRADGSNPSLIQPESATVGGHFMHASAGDANRQRGTPGALSFDRQYGYGDNDSLGFSTVYVKLRQNPQTLDATYRDGFPIVVSQLEYGLWQNWGNHTFRGGRFSYANGTADGGSNGACIFGRGATHKFEYCAFMYSDGEAIEASASGPYTLDHCVSYWCGHRAAYLSGNITLNVLNHIDWGSHLGCLIASGVTSSGQLTLRGSIIANNEAGAIDKKSSSAVLTEGYNLFFPRMTATNGQLGYISTANWTTTAATDVPASTATTTSSQALLTDPGFVNVDDLSFDRCDWALRPGSIARGRGQFYDSLGGAPKDIKGTAFTNRYNMGAVQDATNRPFVSGSRSSA